MSSSTNTSPEPQAVCKRCKDGLYKLKSDWIGLSNDKIICKGGGPHYPEFNEPDIDWSNFREILDTWTKEV